MPEFLLSRIANGDKSAVNDCIDRYSGLVWSLARRFTSSRADTEDAVQEIFISLWNSASRFDDAKSSEPTFVSMIARRRLIDLNRKKKASAKSIPSQPFDKLQLADELDPSRDAELTDEATVALKVLNQLPEEQKQAIKLSIYEGLTHSQIADYMKLPLGTIKTHIRRGLVSVRERLEKSVVLNQGGTI